MGFMLVVPDVIPELSQPEDEAFTANEGGDRTDQADDADVEPVDVVKAPQGSRRE